MKDNEAVMLLGRISAAWRVKFSVDTSEIWLDHLTGLDFECALLAIKELEQDLDRAPSVAAFLAASRAARTRLRLEEERPALMEPPSSPEVAAHGLHEARRALGRKRVSERPEPNTAAQKILQRRLAAMEAEDEPAEEGSR